MLMLLELKMSKATKTFAWHRFLGRARSFQRCSMLDIAKWAMHRHAMALEDEPACRPMSSGRENSRDTDFGNVNGISMEHIVHNVWTTRSCDLGILPLEKISIARDEKIYRENSIRI
jgi:hypothetical protein